MLNNLTINNYKCLTDCSLELKPLNLFAGPNSSGKSTVLQALLTASDNVTEKKGKHGLKNRRTEASNFNDVRNFVTNAKSYEIGISYNGEEPTVLCFTPGSQLLVALKQMKNSPLRKQTGRKKQPITSQLIGQEKSQKRLAKASVLFNLRAVGFKVRPMRSPRPA